MFNLHLSCERSHVHALVDAWQQPTTTHLYGVTVLDWGFTQKQITGYIVLTCQGEVDDAFLLSLAANPAILDYCIYATADNPDAYPFGGCTHHREGVS